MSASTHLDVMRCFLEFEATRASASAFRGNGTHCGRMFATASLPVLDTERHIRAIRESNPPQDTFPRSTDGARWQWLWSSSSMPARQDRSVTAFEPRVSEASTYSSASVDF